MKIQFVSDYVCPYCYVAKKPLVAACQGRDVEIEWVPFELSRPPKPRVDTYNDPVRRAKYAETLVPLCREQGIHMAIPPKVIPRPYTTKAFEGFHYAQAHGCGEAYNDRVYEAYFVHEQDIGDMDVLCKIAAQSGLDEADFRRALMDGDYAEIQRRAAEYSRETLGVRGVPTIFVDGEPIPGGIYTKEGFAALLDDLSKQHATPADADGAPRCDESGCGAPSRCDENGCGAPSRCDENGCGAPSGCDENGCGAPRCDENGCGGE